MADLYKTIVSRFVKDPGQIERLRATALKESPLSLFSKKLEQTSRQNLSSDKDAQELNAKLSTSVCEKEMRTQFAPTSPDDILSKGEGVSKAFVYRARNADASATTSIVQKATANDAVLIKAVPLGTAGEGTTLEDIVHEIAVGNALRDIMVLGGLSPCFAVLYDSFICKDTEKLFEPYNPDLRVAYLVQENAGEGLEYFLAQITDNTLERDTNFLYSNVLLQTLQALFAGFTALGFVHNDLHHNNLRLKRVPDVIASRTWAFQLTPGGVNGSSWIVLRPDEHNGLLCKIIDYGRCRIDMCANPQIVAALGTSVDERIPKIVAKSSGGACHANFLQRYWLSGSGKRIRAPKNLEELGFSDDGNLFNRSGDMMRLAIDLSYPCLNGFPMSPKIEQLLDRLAGGVKWSTAQVWPMQLLSRVCSSIAVAPGKERAILLPLMVVCISKIRDIATTVENTGIYSVLRRITLDLLANKINWATFAAGEKLPTSTKVAMDVVRKYYNSLLEAVKRRKVVDLLQMESEQVHKMSDTLDKQVDEERDEYMLGCELLTNNSIPLNILVAFSVVLFSGDYPYQHSMLLQELLPELNIEINVVNFVRNMEHLFSDLATTSTKIHSSFIRLVPTLFANTVPYVMLWKHHPSRAMPVDLAPQFLKDVFPTNVVDATQVPSDALVMALWPKLSSDPKTCLRCGSATTRQNFCSAICENIALHPASTICNPETIIIATPDTTVKACAVCGSDNVTGFCDGCHRTAYCGVACQRTHWKNGHAQTCSRHQCISGEASCTGVVQVYDTPNNCADWDRYSWEIIPSEIEKVKEIGQGGYGKVWSAKFHKTKVAVKEMFSSSGEKHNFLFETEIYTTLRHPNIIQLIGACSTKLLMIVMEFADYGDLMDRIQKGVIPTDKAVSYMRQIACGLAYMHCVHVVHRDLKPENILFTSPEHLKLTDFGLSAYLPLQSDDMERTGTLMTMAPEVLADEPYDEKCDIFSLAIVLFEMLIGKSPLEGQANKDNENLAIRQAVRFWRTGRPKIPKSVNKALATLIDNCWKQEPSERPTAEKIIDYIDREFAHA